MMRNPWSFDCVQGVCCNKALLEGVGLTAAEAGAEASEAGDEFPEGTSVSAEWGSAGLSGEGASSMLSAQRSCTSDRSCFSTSASSTLPISPPPAGPHSSAPPGTWARAEELTRLQSGSQGGYVHGCAADWKQADMIIKS